MQKRLKALIDDGWGWMAAIVLAVAIFAGFLVNSAPSLFLPTLTLSSRSR